jgi:FSR family fosmidomycin resistance protein-like MFS transporter
VMLFAGGAGTLVMGPLADRVGRRAVLAGSMLLLSPLIYAFILSGPSLGMLFLALVGAVTIGTFGVTVVMGQEYLPGRIGVAAGFTMGLSIGLGGVAAATTFESLLCSGSYDLPLSLARRAHLGGTPRRRRFFRPQPL